MRKAALHGSILAFALLGGRVAAEEVQWRSAASAPASSAPAVSLGRPVQLNAGQRGAASGCVIRDAQVRPASFTGVSLAEPQPIVRGQSPDLPPAAPPGTAPPVPPYPGAPPPPPPPLPPPSGPPLCGPAPARSSCSTPRFWIDGEYLLWVVKSGPMPVPLVTATNPATGTESVVFGDQHMDYGALSGLRIGAGYWFSPEPCWGIDGSVFFLAQGASHFSAHTDGSPTSPILSVGGTPVGIPGFSAANVQVDSLTQLWGLDLNAVRRVYGTDAFTVDLLGGLRYLDLEEKLNIGTNALVLGTPESVNTLDTFKTRSQFYGAQLGARLEYRWCRWSVDLTAKAALGSTYESSDITGSNFVAVGNVPVASTAGGLLATGANSGRFHHSDFAAVYETTLNVRYRFNNYVQAFIGYDFLGWSAVIRPGDQITIPPAARNTQSSTFWAQGLNFGIAFTF